MDGFKCPSPPWPRNDLALASTANNIFEETASRTGHFNFDAGPLGIKTELVNVRRYQRSNRDRIGGRKNFNSLITVRSKSDDAFRAERALIFIIFKSQLSEPALHELLKTVVMSVKQLRHEVTNGYGILPTPILRTRRLEHARDSFMNDQTDLIDFGEASPSVLVNRGTRKKRETTHRDRYPSDVPTSGSISRIR